MEKYYVNDNAQANGDHEVHEQGCGHMPVSKTYLGEFSSCHGAVTKAKTIYSRADGCYYCCNPCHKR